jgi:hypothetical protein
VYFLGIQLLAHGRKPADIGEKDGNIPPFIPGESRSVAVLFQLFQVGTPSGRSYTTATVATVFV